MTIKSSNLNHHRLQLLNRTFYDSNGFWWGRVLLVLFVLGITLANNLFFYWYIYYLGSILFLIVGLDTARFVANDCSKEQFDLIHLTLLDTNTLVNGYQKAILERNFLFLGISQNRKWVASLAIITILSLGYLYIIQRLQHYGFDDRPLLNPYLTWPLSWFVSLTNIILFYRVFRQTGILTGMVFKKGMYAIPATLFLGILIYGGQIALSQGFRSAFPIVGTDFKWLELYFYAGLGLNIVYPLVMQRLLFMLNVHYVWRNR